MDLQKILKRFYDKIKFNPDTGCWEWQGALVGSYGQFAVPQLNERLAHRASYKIFVGPIFNDNFICHKCDNPRCVTPTHLFQGSAKDNNDDKLKKGRDVSFNRNKTHCKRGHEFTEINTHIDLRGMRQCRICSTLRTKKSREKNQWKIFTNDEV